MIFYHIARNTVTLLLLRRRFGRWQRQVLFGSRRGETAVGPLKALEQEFTGKVRCVFAQEVRRDDPEDQREGD